MTEYQFKQGDVVIHALTGEPCMVLELINDEKMPGYTVRRSRDYGVMSVALFEVLPAQKIPLQPQPQQQPPPLPPKQGLAPDGSV
ncbi:MAG: hypothetical protein DRQ49_19285 [Gammaproteobacteria bacterium]|nr:MAG: hypothetical protein DRQ49_19285 [Gammaproteobacteria bacterium]